MSLVALVCVATASAEVVASYDFESGIDPKWKTWENKENKLVAGNGSKQAMEARNGSYFEFSAKSAKQQFVLTADVKHVWGNGTPRVAIWGATGKDKKVETIKEYDIDMDKNFKTISFKFKSLAPGYHRVTFIPGVQTGGCIILDNVKVETK